MKKLFGFQFDEEVKLRLKGISEKRTRSLCFIINEVVKKYVDNFEEKEKQEVINDDKYGPASPPADADEIMRETAKLV